MADRKASRKARKPQRMPPKKKAKSSVRAASTPVAEDESMITDTPRAEESTKSSYDLTKDPWTDEQETSLLKGIIKWKPAGELAFDMSLWNQDLIWYRRTQTLSHACNI